MDILMVLLILIDIWRFIRRKPRPGADRNCKSIVLYNGAISVFDGFTLTGITSPELREAAMVIGRRISIRNS